MNVMLDPVESDVCKFSVFRRSSTGRAVGWPACVMMT